MDVILGSINKGNCYRIICETDLDDNIEIRICLLYWFLAKIMI